MVFESKRRKQSNIMEFGLTEDFTYLDTLQESRRGASPHTNRLRIIKEGPTAFKV